MNEIKTTYQEIEITYNEFSNSWKAKDYRDKPSLEEMKKAIDRKLDKDGKTPFARFKAIRIEYSKPEIGEVTSITEDGSVWFTNSKGERSKDSAISSRRRFYMLNEVSQKSYEEWHKIQANIDGLAFSQKALSETFKVIDMSEINQ